MLSPENEALHKQLFQTNQNLKIAEGKICQLQQTNVYRREVVRLESVLETYEDEKLKLVQELEKVKRDSETVSRSLTEFITHNTVLKNQLKQYRKLSYTDSNTQTDEPAAVCQQCSENESLTNELIEVLDSVQEMVEEKLGSRGCNPSVNNDSVKSAEPLPVVENAGLRNGESLKSSENVGHETEVVTNNYVWSSLSQTTHPSGTGYIPSKNDTALNEMNKFQSIQFIENSSFSGQATTNSSLPLVPGPNLYSQTVKGYSKRVNIFSTSMTRSMDLQKLNDGYVGDRVNIHRFHGKKAHHFKHYIPIHMAEDKPDICVVLAGGNDLPGKTTVLDIANSIIEAGITCKNHGASQVMISSVLPRSDFFCQLKRHDLNTLLKELCIIHNFIFVNNYNMSINDLCYDGVHLSKAGSDKLQSNFLFYLNA